MEEFKDSTEKHQETSRPRPCIPTETSPARQSQGNLEVTSPCEQEPPTTPIPSNLNPLSLSGRSGQAQKVKLIDFKSPDVMRKFMNSLQEISQR
jgi:hypothetical protein